MSQKSWNEQTFPIRARSALIASLLLRLKVCFLLIIFSAFTNPFPDATIAQGTMDDMHKDSGENHEDEAVVETADQTEGLNLPSIGKKMV